MHAPLMHGLQRRGGTATAPILRLSASTNTGRVVSKLPERREQGVETLVRLCKFGTAPSSEPRWMPGAQGPASVRGRFKLQQALSCRCPCGVYKHHAAQRGGQGVQGKQRGATVAFVATN